LPVEKGCADCAQRIKSRVNSTRRLCQSKKVAGRAGHCHLLPVLRLQHNRHWPCGQTRSLCRGAIAAQQSPTQLFLIFYASYFVFVFAREVNFAMKFLVLNAKVFATCKAILSGGSPFDVLTALWPTNEEGKYVIQAEGVRLAFSNHGATLANFWINNTNGEEIDIVLGLDHADSYLGTKSNPFPNGFIGK
jgi:hypothetical protein